MPPRCINNLSNLSKSVRRRRAALGAETALRAASVLYVAVLILLEA